MCRYPRLKSNTGLQIEVGLSSWDGSESSHASLRLFPMLSDGSLKKLRSKNATRIRPYNLMLIIRIREPHRPNPNPRPRPQIVFKQTIKQEKTAEGLRDRGLRWAAGPQPSARSWAPSWDSDGVPLLCLCRCAMQLLECKCKIVQVQTPNPKHETVSPGFLC